MDCSQLSEITIDRCSPEGIYNTTKELIMRKVKYIDQIRVAKEIIYRLETKDQTYYMTNEDVVTLKSTKRYLQLLLEARA